MIMLSYRRGYVYDMRYHIVWCVKHRRNVLVDKITIKLVEVLSKIANDNEFQILEMDIQPDHIHLLVDCSPQNYIPNMIKAMKGVSARLLVKEFGDSFKDQLCNGHLWDSSYLVIMDTEQASSQIQEYMSKQRIR